MISVIVGGLGVIGFALIASLHIALIRSGAPVSKRRAKLPRAKVVRR